MLPSSGLAHTTTTHPGLAFSLASCSAQASPYYLTVSPLSRRINAPVALKQMGFTWRTDSEVAYHEQPVEVIIDGRRWAWIEPGRGHDAVPAKDWPGRWAMWDEGVLIAGVYRRSSYCHFSQRQGTIDQEDIRWRGVRC